MPVGPVTPEARRLLEATRGSLLAGAEQARAGNRLGDVSAAIQRTVELEGFSIIRSLVGHGIGRDMHEDPQIPNYGEPGQGPGARARHGAGDRADGQRRRPEVRVGEDNWAVYSADGSLAAHFEFTVAVTDDGPRVLTPWHEE